MTQLTWKFGFADPNMLSKLNTDGWLIENEHKDLADDYAEAVIRHLKYKLTYREPSSKNKSLKKTEINCLKDLLRAVLDVTDLWNIDDFSDEAKYKLKLLIRGHYLELEEEKWFNDYLNNPTRVYSQLNTKYKREHAHILINKLFDYATWWEMCNKWRSELIIATEILICPYCDRQYITSFFNFSNKKGKLKKTTATIDHFFNKRKYPLFSLSLFNFIPSCHACNSLFKGTNELKTYLYYPDIEKLTHFTLVPLSGKSLDTVDIIIQKNDVDFDIIQHAFYKDDEEKKLLLKRHKSEFVNDINNDIKVLQLNEVYEIHKEYVKDLLEIRRFYENSEYRYYVTNVLNETIYEDSPLKYPVTIDMLRLFLVGGDWMNLTTNSAPRDHKRPLADLTNAILKDDYWILFNSDIEGEE